MVIAAPSDFANNFYCLYHLFADFDKVDKKRFPPLL